MNILLSIQPIHSQAILAGRKTAELRLRFPDSASGVYIYETSPTKAIVGKFSIRKINLCSEDEIVRSHLESLCINENLARKYLAGRSGKVIEVMSVEAICPVPLSVMRECGINPPQSYQYITELPVS